MLVTLDQPNHPILIGSEAFITGDEALYIIDKVLDHSLVIATGHQGKVNHPVMFANAYGRAKVFSITLGHNTPT
ncbi:MAG: ThuA domain-containing protein, partial [Lentimonas sp.]